MSTPLTATLRAGRRLGFLLAAASVGPLAAASTLNNTPDQTMTGGVVGAQFGGAINAQADLNRDGFKDLIVSANTGSDQRGRIQVFNGSRQGFATTPSFTYEGPMDWAQVGASPVVADVNGDGWPDLIVGATNHSGAQAYTGAVLVFLGSANGFPATPSQVIEGPSTNSFFGFKLHGLGDFNGDGFADIAVSAMGANGSAGQIYVFAGSGQGLSPTPVSTLSGRAPWIYFGRIFDVGDVDGDGIADIVVGMVSPTGGIPGMAWVYKGTRTGYASTTWDTLFPVQQADSDLFGDTVTVLGDVDGDGFVDVAVGAPYHLGANAAPTGLVTVYYGSAAGLTASGRTQLLQGDDVPRLSLLGGNMLGNRDMNGDGYPDLLVGPSLYARPNDETKPWPGSVWVYHGGPTGFTPKPKLLAWGQPQSRDELGTTLEAAQVMGDKSLDLIAGSPLYNGGAQDQGIVRVYRGLNARD